MLSIAMSQGGKYTQHVKFGSKLPSNQSGKILTLCDLEGHPTLPFSGRSSLRLIKGDQSDSDFVRNFRFSGRVVKHMLGARQFRLLADHGSQVTSWETSLGEQNLGRFLKY